MAELAYTIVASVALGVLIVSARLIVRSLFAAVVPVAQDDEVEGRPFSEAEYAQNRAESLDWDLQQALRRASRLAHQGQKQEAIAILRAVRDKVADHNVRTVLDQEIGRLGADPQAAQPGSPTRPTPAKAEPPNDPYADRLE